MERELVAGRQRWEGGEYLEDLTGQGGQVSLGHGGIDMFILCYRRDS